MATLSQQSASPEQKSLAQRFWETQMQRHPMIHGILSITGSIIGFFFNGYFVVALGHWLVITAGRIAETALLLATIWVTAAYVSPEFVGRLGTGNVSTLSSLSLIAFSVLPEVIVFGAIITCYTHWGRFFRDRRAANPEWVWATLYSIPTCSFVIMTIITISSFVSSNGTAGHATGVALVARCLSGWLYSLVELIYATLGKRSQPIITTHHVEDRFAEIVATTRATVEAAVATLVTQAQHSVQEQVAHQVATLERHIAPLVSTSIEQMQSIADTTVARGVATLGESIERQMTTLIAQERATQMMLTPLTEDTEAQEVARQQFELLVELINQQQHTIQQLTQQLTAQLLEVKREVRTSVAEIREFHSFSHTQDVPALSAPATVLAALNREEGDATSGEVGQSTQAPDEKPGARTLRFLRDCQQRNYKPTLREIREVCKVSKRTAGVYRDTVFPSAETDESLDTEADTEEEEEPRASNAGISR